LSDPAPPTDPTIKALRERACWYRDFAATAGSPLTRDARLRLAAHFDRLAEMAEATPKQPDGDTPNLA
jgi:hypothetical protein